MKKPRNSEAFQGFWMVGVARIELATPTMSIVFNTLITLPYSCFYHTEIVTGMLKIPTDF